MALIGMSSAAAQAGMTRPGLRRALQAAGVTLIAINPKAFAVEESDLVDFISKRGIAPGRGRPPGAKNKPKL